MNNEFKSKSELSEFPAWAVQIAWIAGLGAIIIGAVMRYLPSIVNMIRSE